MKKQILTILTIGLILGAMLSSAQAAYAASTPEGCIAFTSSKEFTVSLGNGEAIKTWGGTVQFSTDGTNWEDYTIETTVTSVKPPNGEYSVFFRGIGNNCICDYPTGTHFQLNGENIACSGNIENLLDYTVVQENNHPGMVGYAFNELFYNCTNLTEAPELPATTLAQNCYDSMFKFCTSLTKAPELPATKMSFCCYDSMFMCCSSLTEAPELPATTLNEFCYKNMFYACKSLTVPPALPATKLYRQCYYYMFGFTGIKLSDKFGVADDGAFYGLPYRIPEEGTGTNGTESMSIMFANSKGPFAGTPGINTTYYLETPGWTGSGTEDDPFVISDAVGWNTLIKYVNARYSMEGLFFKLGDNIEVTDMVGTYGKPFSGSFDGAGHTLTFNADEAPQYCAPFAYTNNAVIKNLHVAGTIITDNKFAGGLIGRSDGKATIMNCISSVTIDSRIAGDGTHGGFIALGGADFEGCVFDGQLLGSGTTMCGGFLGWANPEGYCSFKNCLFAPQKLTLNGGLDPFSRHLTAATTIENCYYTKYIDRTQGKAGKAITADKGIKVGSENATEYNVSGITASDTGLACGKVFYAEKDEVVPVTIPSVNCELRASAGTLTGEGTSFTLTMPDENVRLYLNVDQITPSDDSADDTTVDKKIPVINASKIKTKGNFKKKQMKITFPTKKSVTNYRVQYRLAGNKTWKSGWSAGKGSYTIKGLKKGSLCDIRIAGYVKQSDGSWLRSSWSKVAYRYMNTVSQKKPKAGKKSITVIWTKDKKSTGYQIRYSLKKSMSGATTKTVRGKSKTKYTIKKLKKNKKYYISIRPIKKKSGKTYQGILTSTKTARVK